MALTCSHCGLVSPDSAQQCDCGELLDKTKNGAGHVNRAPLPKAERFFIFLMCLGTGALFGAVGIGTSLSCTSTPSGGGPPAVAVPFELASGLAGTMWSACVYVGGALVGMTVGGLVALLLTMGGNRRPHDPITAINHSSHEGRMRRRSKIDNNSRHSTRICMSLVVI